MQSQVVVLGAGIVGICCAIELRRRGHAVTLVDRRAPARETSYGNAGMLAGGSIFPEASPALWRHLPELLGNRGTDVHLHYRQLPRMLPFLRHFLRNATPAAHARNTTALGVLLSRAVDTHLALAAEAGAGDLITRRGWLKLYRSRRAWQASMAQEAVLREHGVDFTRLEPAALAELEPGLAPIFAGARWITSAAPVSNPGALADAYANHFAALGGKVITREARALAASGDGWRIDCGDGHLDADTVVVAMGAWSRAILAPLGHALPLIAERGYHQHFQPPATGLNRPVHDIEASYVVAPMSMGYRLTTGVEWAALGAPPTPVQLARVLPMARQAVALGEPLGDTWLGNRPQTPDSLPLIGPLPGHRRLFLASGHGHLGLSLGPITGQLLADAVDGAASDIDPSPYLPSRFG